MNTKESRLNSQKIQFDSLTNRGYLQTIYKGLNIFTFDDGVKFQLSVFWDTSAKQLNKYYFRDAKRREEIIENYKSNYDRQKAYKAESKANPTKSTAANASAAIKEELKKLYPTIEFSVRSSNFANGNSVRIDWTDGPTYDQVDNITSKYQYGHFNGMEDIYENTNDRSDIPQAKYVSCTREMSEEIKEKIITSLEFDRYAEPLTDYEKSRRIREEFNKMDLSPKIEQTEPKNEGKTFEKMEVTAGEVQIVDYSEKAVAVVGDTRPIKDKLKALGGKFNFRLTCGAGWIFKKTDLDKITKALSEDETKPETFENNGIIYEGNEEEEEKAHFEEVEQEYRDNGINLVPKESKDFAEHCANNLEEVEQKQVENELTLTSIGAALKSYFWLYDKESLIIDEAVKRGYVLRTSHTQAEWTQKGIDELKTYPNTLKGEIDKTLDWFVETDIKNGGEVTELTKECFKAQGRDIDEVKIYDNLKDINQAVKDGHIISLCNLSDIVNNRGGVQNERA